MDYVVESYEIVNNKIDHLTRQENRFSARPWTILDKVLDELDIKNPLINYYPDLIEICQINHIHFIEELRPVRKGVLGLQKRLS